MDIVVVVQCQSDLLEVVFALRSASSFTSLLHGWQKQRDQNRDDGNDHQKFDECESALASNR